MANSITPPSVQAVEQTAKEETTKVASAAIEKVDDLVDENGQSLLTAAMREC
jgi:hypothetical protein